MKRMILVGALVLGTSLCSQSYGFDLLDRMLGVRGSGGASTCCDTVIGEPGCGLESPCGIAGCEDPCNGGFEPACGLETAHGSACGCELIGGNPCGPRNGLLDRLFGGLRHGHHGCDGACGLAGCETCEPACGLEAGFPVGCETDCCNSRRPRLLNMLFGQNGHGCETLCDAAPCGCGVAPGAPIAAPAEVDDAPMPPAPVVDPSASLQSKRRVIQASTSYVR